MPRVMPYARMHICVCFCISAEYSINISKIECMHALKGLVGSLRLCSTLANRRLRQGQSFLRMLLLGMVNVRKQSVCMREKDWRCRARVTSARSPCQAHAGLTSPAFHACGSASLFAHVVVIENKNK